MFALLKSRACSYGEDSSRYIILKPSFSIFSINSSSLTIFQVEAYLREIYILSYALLLSLIKIFLKYFFSNKGKGVPFTGINGTDGTISLVD
ncbi:hypothetical protein [Rickettsia helvetica]|uniref:hypothetical protein n=1 Tax=Rickettsia helvetica TaxID=35789 RepID=UPI001E602981|nr:hypothetical protein [Rickettsia helvetica]MCZ6884715.1 hypothetical protein [Rickettsia endosymbiont of Ixodes ricinus]MCZ6896599.1 hypothetical protein [Rickettsia endosymbiont of Ixodes ricinus]